MFRSHFRIILFKGCCSQYRNSSLGIAVCFFFCQSLVTISGVEQRELAKEIDPSSNDSLSASNLSANSTKTLRRIHTTYRARHQTLQSNPRFTKSSSRIHQTLPLISPPQHRTAPRLTRGYTQGLSKARKPSLEARSVVFADSSSLISTPNSRSLQTLN